MGAKFTLVLDTDDPQGLRDALEIARLLNKNHHTGLGESLPKAKIGKISLIKLVRQVAKDVEEGKMTSSLRDSKRFVDDRWGLLQRE
jgi:hypothetical protein